ncbi:hypothetical protein [Phenylobacterium sp.]|jgi:hypothetical protein|uniref:hypothetical protein n=1 Tax=Phenylobacterium sp. TaxID=1871053 RepID=UPI002F3F41DC
MLTRLYTVHSCNQEAVQCVAIVNGKPTEVTVSGLTVELVADDGGKSQTESYIPDDLAADLAIFAVGAKIVVTYSAPETPVAAVEKDAA